MVDPIDGTEGDGADDTEISPLSVNPSATQNFSMPGGLTVGEALGTYNERQGLATTQSQANIELLQKAMDELRDRRVGPSNSEKWLALAAALGQPTKTGAIGETLSGVAQALGKYKAAGREAEQEKQTLLTKYGLEIGGERYKQLQSAANQAGQVYRTVAATQLATQKAMMPKLSEVLQDQKTGEVLGVYTTFDGQTITKPIAKLNPKQTLLGWDRDTGQIITGNPSDPSSINSTPIPGYVKPAKVYTPAERTQLFDAKSIVDNGNIAVRNIDRALSLNNLAYEGAFAGPGITLARITGIGKETAAYTSQMQSLMDQQVITQLKATFGSQFTAAEGDWLKRASGFAGMTRPERAALLKEGRDLAILRMRNAQNTVLGIQGGGFNYRPTPEAAPSQGAPAVKILSRRPAGE